MRITLRILAFSRYRNRLGVGATGIRYGIGLARSTAITAGPSGWRGNLLWYRELEGTAAPTHGLEGEDVVSQDSCCSTLVLA